MSSGKLLVHCTSCCIERCVAIAEITATNDAVSIDRRRLVATIFTLRAITGRKGCASTYSTVWSACDLFDPWPRLHILYAIF